MKVMSTKINFISYLNQKHTAVGCAWRKGDAVNLLTYWHPKQKQLPLRLWAYPLFNHQRRNNYSGQFKK